MTPLYLNGEFTDVESAGISIEDRGYQFGDGVYEGIRIYNGHPFRLGRHLERLHRSAAGIEMKVSDPSLESACLEIIKRRGLADGFLYIQVTRGAAPRSHVWSDLKQTVLAYVRKVPDRDRARGWKAITYPDIRWDRCNLKTLNLLPNVMAKQKAVAAGAQEAIFVKDGFLTEACSANAFVVLDGKIHTHPLTSRILPGISREIVIELAGDVVEEPVPLEAVLKAEELFLTGTTTEVTGVVQVDGAEIGGPGPVTRKLAAAYEELWQRECAGTIVEGTPE